MKRKVALVTGASRGIGKAIAEAFAKEGYDLFITCRDSVKVLEGFADSLSEKYNIACTPCAGDISKPEDVEKIFENIYELDVLVNNAGISYIGLLTDMSVDEWNSVISVNLNSAFYMCKKAVPIMLSKKEGKIINISSIWGERGASMEVAYSASKGGLNAMTKALAKELAPSNIQVNAIACGLIDTDMNSHFSQEEIDSIIDEIPADRIGKPEEVAELVIKLSEGSKYLTGQIIGFDGGW